MTQTLDKLKTQYSKILIVAFMFSLCGSLFSVLSGVFNGLYVATEKTYIPLLVMSISALSVAGISTILAFILLIIGCSKIKQYQHQERFLEYQMNQKNDQYR